ncbi:MAG: PEGA domain-containing protein [Lachnospiraceae bacterium]|nr:PEGA domain-containing protein [Lachnospiraceae bacterium]
MKKPRISIVISSIILMLLCCGCGKTGQEISSSGNETAVQESSQTNNNVAGSVEVQNSRQEVVYGPDSYDSEDTAILLKKSTEESTITLYNMEVDRQYTLQVTGTSTLYDKYGEPISLAQLQPGEIVDVTFLKDIKRLNSLQLSPDSWNNTSVSRYQLDWERANLTIGADVYNLPEDVVLLSDGKVIETMDLNPVDTLSFRGIGSDVYSVVVEKGHGYLRLENDVNFIGGFIEIGQSIIHVIQEDMLLTVPEGSYEVLISQNGGGGTKQVTIGRNQEVTLDIGDLEVALVQYGTVVFTTTPEEVTLYIDGDKVDVSAPVTLEYGIHQIIARAEGYKTMTSYIKVGQASAGIDLELDKIEEEEEEDDTEYYKVHIDAPEGAEVYLDNNYIGIAPVSFKKEAGTHTIILRKTGYATRSYTIVVDDEEKDVSYSFADLALNGSLDSSLNSSLDSSLDDTVSSVLDTILFQ